MRKRIAALILCMLLTVQIAAPPAGAAEHVYFVAAGENILPLSDSTMPFWYNGYLFISSSIFTGIAGDALDIGRIRNNSMKLVILHSGGRSLRFEWEKVYAQDTDGNTYYPGAVYRNGEIYVPASVVARFFDLQYSVTEIDTRWNGEDIQGDLVWLRRPGNVLSDKAFADAALYQISNRYMEYLREKEKKEETQTPVQPQQQEPPAEEVPDVSDEPDDAELSGRSVYLCLAAGTDTAALLDILDRYGAQAAFFCTPEFMETQGDLLRRMTVTGQAIGILADAGDEVQTVAEQLEAGNRALEQATCGRSRLALIQNGDQAARQAAGEAGYRCLEPDLDRSGYELRGVSNAGSLLRQVSERQGNVNVWLADTVTTAGLGAFLRAAGEAEGRCLAWTETA